MWCEPQTYQALEIPKILRILASGCRSELGQSVLERTVPAGDGTALSRRVGRLRSYLQLTRQKGASTGSRYRDSARSVPR